MSWYSKSLFAEKDWSKRKFFSNAIHTVDVFLGAYPTFYKTDLSTAITV
jgi:hypothetical protein